MKKRIEKRPSRAEFSRAQAVMAWFACTFVFASASTARAQVALDSVRVLISDGRVSVERSGELWVLNEGQTVTPGQTVVTGADGHAQLELSDGSTVEVFPNSRLVIQANHSNLRDLLDLYVGKIRLKLQHLTNDALPYRVNSPTAVISVRGTVFDVEVDASQATTVHVEEGSVGVRHLLFGGGEVVVETGQTLRVVPNQPLMAPKGTPPVVVVGRIAKVVGETVARIEQSIGSRSGGTNGSGGSGTGSASGPAIHAPVSTPTTGDPGSNNPAPAPGQGGSSSPPGDKLP